MEQKPFTPKMHIITGANGAGKSTLYEHVLKPILTDIAFINADIIQKEELNDVSMDASYAAAKIAAERRDQCLENKKSFVTETVFSHPSKLELIKEAIAIGFKIIVYHVNVRDADLSVLRVASRLNNGGHNVPENKIRQRYERNKPLIKQAILMADYGFVYDNSRLLKLPDLQISFRNGQVKAISGRIPPWARELYADNLSDYSFEQQNAGAASNQILGEMAKKLSKNSATEPLLARDFAKTYLGKIIGESKHHYLQYSEEEQQYYAHFKSKFSQKIDLGKVVSIQYFENQRYAEIDFVKNDLNT